MYACNLFSFCTSATMQLLSYADFSLEQLGYCDYCNVSFQARSEKQRQTLSKAGNLGMFISVGKYGAKLYYTIMTIKLTL